MPDTHDPIARAKAQAEEWRAMREQALAETRFSRCTPADLIRIAETNRDLQGNTLKDGTDIMALDDAWFATFGEPLCHPVGPGGEESTPPQSPAVPIDQHPMLTLPDDAMLRPRDVHRVFGYSKSTLKRHVAAGKFPAPQRAAPGQRYVGWPARQLKAWLVGNAAK